MSVKRSWRLQKLASLPISSSTREKIIKDLIQRKKNSITLFAWKVQDKKVVEAFFSKQDALRNWVRQEAGGIFTNGAPFPSSVRIVKLQVHAKVLVNHIQQGRILNIPILKTDPRFLDVQIPPNLFDDFPSNPAKAGMKQGGEE